VRRPNIGSAPTHQETMNHCSETDETIFPLSSPTSENPVTACTRKGVFSPTRLARGSALVWTVTVNVRFRYKGMAIMRVAIYARVSTKGVGRQDVENQLRQLRVFAESQSWSVVHEFVDRQSAKSSDREQFQLMFQIGIHPRLRRSALLEP
jgi:predicted site-specific integrase-resolvase